MKAFRALLDFIYLAQYESHSSETLRYLTDALAKFHEHKDALSKAGVRDGKRRKGLFNIKKIELMHHVARLVERLGSVMQFSTDQTEHCHINMAKVPYEATNKKDYAVQMCRYLDRREKIHLFTAYQAWLDCIRTGDDDVVERLLSYRDEDMDDATADSEEHIAVDDVLKGEGNVSSYSLRPDAVGRFARQFLPKPTVNFFQIDASLVPRNDTTAFRFISRIPCANVSLKTASKMYQLPDLFESLSTFYGRSALPYTEVDIWTSVRMQLRAVHDEDLILSPYTVIARPDDHHHPGLYNFVLVKDDHNAGFSGIRGEVTQLGKTDLLTPGLQVILLHSCECCFALPAPVFGIQQSPIS